jgi:hypothetical protein
MNRTRIHKTFYIILLIGIVIFGGLFKYTSGLITKSDYHDDYVTNYKSSGSDDNIVVEISSFLFFPSLLLAVFRRKNNINFLEFIFAITAALVQICFLYSIELGSIKKTILVNHL